MSQLGGYGPTIIAVMWVETAISLLFVLMRIFTRIRLNRNAGWDDVLIAVSWALLMPYAVACTVAAYHGFGRHSSELAGEQFAYATRAEIIGQTFLIIGIAFSKASVSVFLLRITIVTWHKWVLYFLMFAVSVVCFFTALFDFIRCDPVEYVWNPTIPANCWISTTSFTSLSLTLGSVSAIADFVLATLPWFILWNLQMKRKEKILIASSMSLGIFAMVCGIVRTISLEGLTARSDYSYETVGLILWSSTELMITILTATIPTLRPLYKLVRNGYYRNNYEYSHNSKPGSNGFRLKNIPSDNERPKLGPHQHFSKANVAVGEQNIDDRSDKSILERADRNIMRTDVVTVEYGR